MGNKCDNRMNLIPSSHLGETELSDIHINCWRALARQLTILYNSEKKAKSRLRAVSLFSLDSHVRERASSGEAARNESETARSPGKICLM